MNDNMDKFLDFLKYEKNYSENTIIGYSNHLQLFVSFLNDNNIENVHKVDYNLIRKYINYLYDIFLFFRY